MKQLDERVKKLLEAQPLWYVGTCSDVPEVSLIGFKDILDDGRLLLCDVFMKNTKKNILSNGYVCISAGDPETMEGYQIFGKAEYVSEGAYVDEWNSNAQMMSGGKLFAKGVVLVTPERVRVMSVCSTNGKEL